MELAINRRQIHIVLLSIRVEKMKKARAHLLTLIENSLMPILRRTKPAWDREKRAIRFNLKGKNTLNPGKVYNNHCMNMKKASQFIVLCIIASLNLSLPILAHAESQISDVKVSF